MLTMSLADAMSLATAELRDAAPMRRPVPDRNLPLAIVEHTVEFEVVCLGQIIGHYPDLDVRLHVQSDGSQYELIAVEVPVVAPGFVHTKPVNTVEFSGDTRDVNGRSIWQQCVADLASSTRLQGEVDALIEFNGQ